MGPGGHPLLVVLTLANINQNVAPIVGRAGAVITAAFRARLAQVPASPRVGGVEAVIRAPVAVAVPIIDVRFLGVGPSAPVAGSHMAAVGISTMVPDLHVYVLGDAVELASRSAGVDVSGAGGVPDPSKSVQAQAPTTSKQCN